MHPLLRITPPAFLAEPALAAVMAALPEARVVGGAVRDTLAGRDVGEIDLATPRTPEQVTEALQAAGIRAVPTGIGARHGDRGGGRSRLRGHHAAPRHRDRRTARGGGIHRRLAGGCRAARLHDQCDVADAHRRGVRLFRRDCRPACRHSALRRRPGNPHRRGLSADPAIFPFLCALREGDRRSGRAGGDPRRCARSGQAVGRACVERAGPNPCGARSASRGRL